MRKSIKVHQKKPGRPATGRDPAITIRLPKEVLGEVETWASEQDGEPNRSQAIRRLIELGLTVRATKSKQAPQARADRAKELAAQAIDEMSDPAALPEEHAQRRRRLTKGPEEFRDLRVDRPKVKGK
jgi:Arc/MetJ-type ribon-helix-helix transcriptional regulator